MMCLIGDTFLLEGGMESNEIVNAISKLNFVGNVIPHSWFESIQRNVGKPYLVAIIMLSEIMYWYSGVVIRDENTLDVVGYEKRFKADKLQLSSKYFAEHFGFSQRQVSDAIAYLRDEGLITTELRQLDYESGTASNVQFVEPIPDTIEKITFRTYETSRRNLRDLSQKSTPLRREEKRGKNKREKNKTEKRLKQNEREKSLHFSKSRKMPVNKKSVVDIVNQNKKYKTAVIGKEDNGQDAASQTREVPVEFSLESVKGKATQLIIKFLYDETYKVLDEKGQSRDLAAYMKSKRWVGMNIGLIKNTILRSCKTQEDVDKKVSLWCGIIVDYYKDKFWCKVAIDVTQLLKFAQGSAISKEHVQPVLKKLFSDGGLESVVKIDIDKLDSSFVNALRCKGVFMNKNHAFFDKLSDEAQSVISKCKAFDGVMRYAKDCREDD